MVSPEQMQSIADKYQEVIRRAMVEGDFRARLLKDPGTVLRENGLDFPADVQVRAVESTDKVVYLALPPKPSEELADEQLEQVAGGSTASTAGTIGTASSFTGTILSAGTIGTAGSAG